MENPEVIVIGSGIGGLCCAGLLAKAGKRVLVLESHSKPGGAAHGFEKNGYRFESGPSLWSGLGVWPTTNPLGQVLKALNQKVELIKYKDWNVQIPEGDFTIAVGDKRFNDQINLISGKNAVKEWENFTKIIKPIGAAANAIPLLALNQNKETIFQVLKRSKTLLKHLKSFKYLGGAFGKLVDNHLKDPFLKNWVELLCFLISGLSKDETNAAAMATLFDDWFKPNAYLEYPKGGSESIVNALLNGFYSFGGQLRLNSKVNQIIVKDEIAIGIELKNGEKIFAKHIVSNADIWNTIELLPKEVAKKWKFDRAKTPKCNSFLHIHLGFNAEGLKNIPIHSIWVDDWRKGITAEQNVVVLSIPSAIDSSMAPPNKYTLHGYTPANEPWDKWKDIKVGSQEYIKAKEARCSIFWEPIKKLIPDIEERIEVKMLGTPLTHQRFLNTTNGSYGPALSAAEGLFPGNKTPIKNLLLCGSSTFPGIGIPPVAASGAMAANTILGSKFQKNLIEELQL
tara:strand:+ start:1154 stop:2683 length:1530 start_codon:yes stop_codon:yes gene_type:complete